MSSGGARSVGRDGRTSPAVRPRLEDACVVDVRGVRIQDVPFVRLGGRRSARRRRDRHSPI
eukprot:2224575-Pyramimonas_sp.AAC.1